MPREEIRAGMRLHAGGGPVEMPSSRRPEKSQVKRGTFLTSKGGTVRGASDEGATVLHRQPRSDPVSDSIAPLHKWLIERKRAEVLAMAERVVLAKAKLIGIKKARRGK